ncbi:response regulator receiver protein [Chthoniobacter flavus Ellin428]|uniref:Response regulator receiver protein n=1 Tax=Chthoniobacter flavus Ellin428 TaxID=497964 RepID=B4D4D9_9BACT|nr:response regulator [Chthoniobacter flavus]EDY18740.1 response regulator receiver protein [Chthoniobacter flavus Ellin428]TCO89020.1 two-component system cell cycle response regulator DivK [Chthoniobacter flavus]
MPTTILSPRASTAARTFRILAVDDDPNSTLLTKIALERTGRFAVCEVNDPHAAAAAARLFGPDLVVMDVDMPRLDGRAAALLIQSIAGLEEVPVLFVTSLIPEGTAASRNAFGWHGPLEKPVSPKRLARAIDHILQHGVLDS